MQAHDTTPDFLSWSYPKLSVEDRRDLRTLCLLLCEPEEGQLDTDVINALREIVRNDPIKVSRLVYWGDRRIPNPVKESS